MLHTIHDFFRIYQEAAWNKDIKLMQSLYHDDVVIFDMWDQGYQKGAGAWAKSIEEWLGSLGSERVRVSFEQVNCNETDEIAFASALIQFEAISPEGSRIRGMKNRITIGFVRTSNSWKVIHQHTSAPVRSKDLSAILDIES